jgi:hypothetical protein
VSLQAHGLVSPTNDTGDWRHAFERDALDDLLQRLLDEAEPVELFSDAVGITEAASLCSCAPVEIVHLLLGGDISWKGRRGTGHGIASLLVRADELRVRMDKQELPGPTLREAAVETEIRPEALSSLIAMGAMTTEIAVDALTRSSVTIIHQASLKHFFEDHAELKDVAQKVGRCLWNTTECLRMAGIEPKFKESEFRLTYYSYDIIDACFHRLARNSLTSWPRDIYFNGKRIDKSHFQI